MPTDLACLRRSVERMWPRRVPTRFGPATRLRRPKNQWNQGPLATQQAEMCPRTANSGQGQKRNIAGANPALTRKLAALSDKLATCKGPACRSLEDQGPQ